MKKTCKDCPCYYDYESNDVSTQYWEGECRLNPPTPDKGWPKISQATDYGWCYKGRCIMNTEVMRSSIQLTI